MSAESLNVRQKLFLELVFKVLKLKELLNSDQEKEKIEKKSGFFTKLSKMVSFKDKGKMN